jgi:glycosyltransferase involved in cell wall biosynthesis
LPLLSLQLLKQGWHVAWVGHNPSPPAGMPQQVEWIHSPHKKFWSQFALFKLLRQRNPGWFFTPSGIPPILYRGRMAVTVHDMSVYVSPQSFSFGQRLRLRSIMKVAVRHASVIFTPSTYSKEQVIKFWKLPADHIFVTPLSFDPGHDAAEEVAHVQPEHPIILYVSRIEVKKNVARIIEAFAALKNTTAQLVLAGRDGVGADVIKKQIAALPKAVKERVFLPGYITNGQREWLLLNSKVLVVPGALEGFSLPLLEAFAHGLPAICAQAGPLPEIGADAVLYASPDNTEEWTAAMTIMLDSKETRNQFVVKVQEREKQFTWQKTAELSAESFSKG